MEIDESISYLKKIVEGKQNNLDDYKKTVEKIEFLIKNRNLQAKNMKQGGI